LAHNLDSFKQTYKTAIERFKTDALEFELKGKDLTDWQQYFNGWPCAVHQGFHLEFVDNKVAMVCIVDVKPEHLGGKGEHAINGATISGILDCAVSVAGFMHYKEKTCGTISNNILMKRPLYGRHIICLGKVTKRSKNLCFGESIIVNDNALICASSDSIIAVASQYSDTV
jgi:acyl-coenzyme A thioesterase PaaI-like protein